MDAARWLQLSPHLDALLELPAPARARRLDEIALQDAELAAELARMLALEAGREDFLAQPLVVPRALREGSEVGPYRLEALLGEGGMGQVWRASRADGLYQRRVALKLLRPGLADRSLRMRFAREREILARLAHPHIAGLLDAGISAEGVPYLALEYVEGEPITRYWQRLDVPLPTRLRMFRQVCEAVTHAHANLVVHCDLKPSNILVTADGQVRLLDFGIAKLLDGAAPRDATRTGARAFTLHYAAPEQIRGAPVTTMTDVYSLGVVLYELLTGMKPYRLKRQSDAEWEEAILAHDPVRPSQMLLRQSELKADRVQRQALRRRARRLMGDLDNIVHKTLCKAPEQRYPSVEALSQDLQRHLDGQPVRARPVGALYRLQKYVRRHRWGIATAAAALGVLAIAVGAVVWQSREAMEEARRAQAMRGFIVGVFEQAGGTPGDRALDLRALLDGAVARGDRELARQPRAQAELLGVIAGLRMGLGDDAEAKRLLDRQSALMARLPSLPAGLRIDAAAQRGQVLRRLGDAQGCIATMIPLAPLAAGERRHLPASVAEFQSQLGRCLRARGDVDGARSLFEQALALRRETRTPGAAVEEIESRLDLAALQADIGRTHEALVGYRDAQARLEAEAGPRHPLQVDIGRQMAAVLRRQGHPGRAEVHLIDTLAAAQDLHGAQHPVTLGIRRELADVLIDQSRFRDAAVPLRHRHGVLVARLGALHPDLFDSHLALSRVEWQLERLGAALASARAATAIARRSGDGERTVRGLLAQAQLLHEAGRSDEARPLLLDARALRSASAGAADPLVAEVDRALGEVDAALGQPGAIARLGRALHFLDAGYGPRDPRTQLARLALARQQAAHGERIGEQGLAAIAAGARGTFEPQPLAWRAAAYLQAVRCNGSERTAAVSRLSRLYAAVRRAQPDGSTTEREIARLLRQCRRARGDFMPTGTL
ncbi:MAG: protein kinase domain-containing protein [Pseudomonadota bacterium]